MALTIYREEFSIWQNPCSLGSDNQSDNQFLNVKSDSDLTFKNLVLGVRGLDMEIFRTLQECPLKSGCRIVALKSR